MRKNKGGRPTKMTESTVKKLEEAFLMGCTDLEACCYADISKVTLYKYQDDNPEFANRKEVLKKNPFMIARQSVLKGAKKDLQTARWLVDKEDGKPMQQVRLDKDSQITVNIKGYKE